MPHLFARLLALAALLVLPAAVAGIVAPRTTSPSGNVALPLGHNDQTFKILQLADMHIKTGTDYGCLNIPRDGSPCGDRNTTDFIGRLLDDERPDLVVFTGDNVAFPPDAKKAIEIFTEPVINRSIPWAAVFGNHDAQGNMDNAQMMDIIESLPHTVTSFGPRDIDGVGNFAVEVIDSSNETVFSLFFLDSGAYSTDPDIGGYDWIRPSQVAWYRNASAEISYNNPHDPPELVFFHIPFPEYHNATENVVGDKQERVNSAQVNGGFFAALTDVGKAVATFVGHDHVNDFCGRSPENPLLALCYGGGVGYGTYGRRSWERRARIINIEDGGRLVRTWKRLDTGPKGTPMPMVHEQILWQANW
ncbi:hypothetical protein H696_01164 [Fonticula alba]|uniref:Calcineurin-like phosphoesterase domain-containing protein n=1 Tax=Fonticula alba TaxID=691883 RepID=A0A058ZCT5_FONAL|nr:hypothetical protein H696_01164 [Fonticula alba]KCV71743.1 hypothetical protein H696_01164 [Fonticula alba]|eukprot:XP_009493321.1 hypothetical protein H696_01164 [Fonticula alba]